MKTVDASEFPFVATLPKAEIKAVKSMWDLWNDFKSHIRTNGQLIPLAVVPSLAGVSRQRVHQWLTEGRLESVQYFGHTFITEDTLLDFIKVERKSGRPVSLAFKVLQRKDAKRQQKEKY